MGHIPITSPSKAPVNISIKLCFHMKKASIDVITKAIAQALVLAIFKGTRAIIKNNMGTKANKK